jgi:hypothetical protein
MWQPLKLYIAHLIICVRHVFENYKTEDLQVSKIYLYYSYITGSLQYNEPFYTGE